MEPGQFGKRNGLDGKKHRKGKDTGMNTINESLADSPCTGRCANLGYPGDIRCEGCGRTRDEINTWYSLSILERKLINIDNWKQYMPKQKQDGLLRSREEINRKLNGGTKAEDLGL